MVTLLPEQPADAPVIETLLDTAFGPDRFQKTAYAYRQDRPPEPDLCFVARSGEALVGTLRHWAVQVDQGPETVLLLGPIAVAPQFQGQGVGDRLIRHGLLAARRLGWTMVVLVGDEGYYRRFGFAAAAPHGLVMPGEAPARVLARPLRPWAGTGGALRPLPVLSSPRAAVE